MHRWQLLHYWQDDVSGNQLKKPNPNKTIPESNWLNHKLYQLIKVKT
jgi:hypothetical protein